MEYSFDNFNVFNSNKFAYGACKLIAETLPYSSYNPLYIYGDKNTGKTHLMKAIVNYIKNNNNDINVLYLNNDDIFSIIEEIKNDLEKNKIRFVAYDLIIFDDIFDINYSDSLAKDLEEQWCEIFDYLLLNNKTMIFTGNIEPENLKKTYCKFGLRVEYGLSVKIFPQAN